MYKFNDQELSQVTGGGNAWGIFGFLIGGLISFAIGFLDGIKRPLKCNS